MMSYRRRRGTPSCAAAALRLMGACTPSGAACPYAAWKRSQSRSRSLLQAVPAQTGGPAFAASHPLRARGGQEFAHQGTASPYGLR